MEDVRELKSVLERVEGRLIAAGKLYGAMNFAVWLAIMLLYYVMLGLFQPDWRFNFLYWPLGFAVAMAFTGRIWGRLKRLGRVTGREIESSPLAGILIGLSWATGIVLGWIIVPGLNPGVTEEASLATGFLTFIAFSVFAMWLVMAGFNPKNGEREIIPAFLIPALGIPRSTGMAEGAIVWAGFVVAAGFSLTILWYLYSAFRAIER
ncbi:hypothetical protein [Thermococcus sp. AM4]|uniref:hypothetical protein n=1 Tax=Thermococcus sp. (strain AM4) TaxID=246969 RepID=UPI0002299A08|nr:hypothetical protein [Thermococcus sp. AM4]AEO14021.1 hypothetical protein TAM4_2435 [Thermococcus sp. AM4]